MSSKPPEGLAADQVDSLAAVLGAVRGSRLRTRPDLVRRLGLGRNVVSQRVTQLMDFGLLDEGQLAPSTGGRPSRELRFRAEAGCLLVAELGATELQAGLSDLDGSLLAQRTEPCDVAAGPEATLARLQQIFDELLAERPVQAPVWGVGIGVPGPVEFSRGRPIAPPIMPGWDGYPVRERLSAIYQAPAWVDNDVNVMALGELRAGIGRNELELLYVKVGTGIGAGLISAGRLHRGAQGAAGDIGHVSVLDDDSVLCRCGNTGCLEALAGGYALSRDGLAIARSGRSPALADVLSATSQITARDVIAAAGAGDPACLALVTRSGRLVGRVLATLVNFYNPSLIVLGGQVSSGGDIFLGELRRTVYGRSTALAARDLRIKTSPLGDRAGLLGAAFLAADQLFSRACLGHWIQNGSPAGRPELSGEGVAA
ncbi:MAG TPA: ROK family protein [Jatrophihabitans sp.]|jgi:glucokinase-like ROK family protein|uniref:ROK family protein n=1 Tax=Jatrophihabitans sp. TaxID=1932789 RepID=UPI002F00142D